MNSAINIRSENDTALPIYDLWNKVSLFEETPSMQSLNYAPHFTFAIYEDLDINQLELAAEEATNNLSVLPITFSKISVFDAEKLVLWLEADGASKLFEIHKKIHQIIEPSKCHEYYKPDMWQPHCTIGMNFNLENRDKVLDFAKKPIEPFTVQFDTFDWLTFKLIDILAEINLSK